MKWVEVKMKGLGVLGNADYKLTCMLDHSAMLTVQVGQPGARVGAGAWACAGAALLFCSRPGCTLAAARPKVVPVADRNLPCPPPPQTEKYGVFDCKPLAFIWAKFPEFYNPSNTVMLDDLR